MGLEGAVGLTNVLFGRVPLEDALPPWGDGTLQVLPSGALPPNSSELLGSAGMEEVLRELEGLTDIVLIDAPPLLPVNDVAVLGSMTSGLLMVVPSNGTSREQVKRAAATANGVVATCLGSSLTRCRPVAGRLRVRLRRPLQRRERHRKSCRATRARWEAARSSREETSPGCGAEPAVPPPQRTRRRPRCPIWRRSAPPSMSCPTWRKRQPPPPSRPPYGVAGLTADAQTGRCSCHDVLDGSTAGGTAELLPKHGRDLPERRLAGRRRGPAGVGADVHPGAPRSSGGLVDRAGRWPPRTAP